MFAALAPHFRALAHGRVAALGDDLLGKIDIAIDEVAACTASTHACVAAIVGLRRTLFPGASPHQPVQKGPAIPQAASAESLSVT
jgi:hypothetical protein